MDHYRLALTHILVRKGQLRKNIVLCLSILELRLKVRYTAYCLWLDTLLIAQLEDNVCSRIVASTMYYAISCYWLMECCCMRFVKFALSGSLVPSKRKC